MFLNTLLLYGTALGSVPIIIHLLNKRRFRPVQWAAMEFLLQAIQKNARRLQIRDLILMALRTLAVVCLALALARPAISAKGLLGASGKTAAVILIDNSLSMGYNNGRESRFDVAKRLAKSVISQMDKNSVCGVYTFNDDLHAPLGDPSQNLAYLEQELERSVHLSDGGTDIYNALNKVWSETVSKSKEFMLADREIYIISDMQSRPWSQKDVSAEFKELLRKVSSEVSLYVINAGDAGSENAAIVDLSPNDTLVTADMPVAFVAKIKNFGETPLKDIRVDLYVDATGKDDKPSERATVDLDGGAIGTVTFETRFKRGGDHRVEARLAGDRLAGDDRRFCTIEVIDETRMLLVDGRDQRSDDPLSTESGYLRFALSPIDVENPEKQSVVQCESVPHYRLADKNLLNYQAIVLSNVPRLNQHTATQLDKFVRNGMGLMIFLGDQLDAPAYEALLGVNGTKLLPAKIGQPWGEAPTLEAKLPPGFSFATDRLSHPIMADFKVADCVDLLEKVQVYRGYDLEPLADDNVRVVAWLANGKPAVIERKLGAGFIYLFGFPATTKWSNFPTQHAFAIMMLRTAQLMTLGSRPPKNLSVNEHIQCLLHMSDQNTTVKILPPPPGQRQETKPELNQGRALVQYEETGKAGFYDLVLEKLPQQTITYALNSNAEIESNLTTISPEQIKLDYPGFKFVYVGKSEDFQKKLVSERQGTELWPWLMAMVFLCLAAESILAVRWAPRD